MKKIRLICGLWAAEITPELGANITSLTWKEQPVLRTPEQSVDAYQFGMPILLPANRTRAGSFIFEGRTYHLPVNEPAAPAHLHGLVHNQPFTLEFHSPQEARLSYCSTPEVYPFPFRLTVVYTLTEEGLCTSHTLENTGSTNMPYTFCLHTTFVAPEYFSVPLKAEQQRDAHHLPTGQYIPLSEDQLSIVTGINPQGRVISGYYLAAEHTAHIGQFSYRCSENNDHWILYNAGGNAGILCVEPQCGAVDGLNIPDGHRILAPGEKEVFTTFLASEK